MNWKALCLEAFAVVASYLVITISVAGAVTIRTYDSAGTPVGSPITYSSGSLVSRDISMDPETLELSFSVDNGSASVNIEGVWLYKCKDKTPHECMDSIFFVPDSFPGEVDTSYAWGDISGGSPETANLLYFVKLNKEGITSWLGFWTAVKRGSESSFSVTHVDISEIGVYAQNVDIIPTIRQFIGSYGMIPANPGWVSRVVFQGASSVYDIGIAGEASLESPSRPVSQEVTGNEIASVSWDYNFMFPVSGSVRNGMTLNYNPTYTCGMLGCESDVGESSANCCLDCGCPPGYYCDSSKGCSQVSAIRLSLYGSVSPKVSNCYESHVVSIPVEIEGAPSSYTLTESWCRLGGTYSICTCTRGSGNIFVCAVNVPPVDECDSGEFKISNNGIRLNIEYMDGAAKKNKYIETSFPDVTVGSFTCGDYGCEAGLGESSANCCYDCGCPSGYCDYEWGADPSSADCNSDLSSSDLSAASVKPAHFYTHIPGDSVLMNIVINNKPKTLSVEQASCEMGCNDGLGVCESTCLIDWSQMQSSDPGKYNMSVMISFTISGYDTMRDYILSPVIAFDVRYRNGTGGYIEKSLQKTFNQISIGAHWCGDMVCGTDEDQQDCCFDCSCPAGKYCDTQSTNGPTHGDGCRADSMKLAVDSIGLLSLQDSSKEHRIPILMHVSNYPTGISIVPSCWLADEGIDCKISCSQVSSNSIDEYNLSCTMTVPAIDYTTSPYYNPSTREITLSQNSLNISLYYNDGYRKGVKNFVHGLGEVVINVTSHCGEGSGDPFMMCEGWLGEDQTNCCRDCGCGSFGDNYFCYMGASPNGECVDNSSIGFRITGSEPSVWDCVIGKIGGDCIYLKSHVINTHVVNSPPDLQITESFYSLDGANTTSIKCVKTATYGNWDCAFIPERLSGGTGTVNRTIEMFASVTYALNNSLVVDDLSATAVFNTSKTKSEALINCEEEIERLREQIARLQSNQGGYEGWGWLYYVIGAVMIGVGIAILVSCCWVPEPTRGCCTMGVILIVMGGVQIVMGLLSQQEGTDLTTQIEQLEDLIEQKEQMCSSEKFEQSAAATGGVNPLTPVEY